MWKMLIFQKPWRRLSDCHRASWQSLVTQLWGQLCEQNKKGKALHYLDSEMWALLPKAEDGLKPCQNRFTSLKRQACCKLLVAYNKYFTLAVEGIGFWASPSSTAPRNHPWQAWRTMWDTGDRTSIHIRLAVCKANILLRALLQLQHIFCPLLNIPFLAGIFINPVASIILHIYWWINVLYRPASGQRVPWYLQLALGRDSQIRSLLLA